ncbi:hypothetical protein F2Q70_00028331 [Brassica cretica]|uniref:Uncharacterized protein n=1 Tax=Brassica cretica TaxID=69181 RepID=A0A8S9L6P5_BRACR|nr:hypothetical protein F2Q70_00028331 [Brassica cretica]
MAGLTLFFSFLSLSLIISGARSRVLSPLPLNNSILISDGVHDVSDYKFLSLDPTKTLSGTECEHVYGFLPCANNVGGYVFQVLTFGCLLIVGDYFLSVGRSQLFLIFDVGFYGGIIFPLLTMFPRIVLMLANGLSLGSDVANSFVDNNVGVTAGYTVFALTIQWGACVVFRITGPSLENEERKTITSDLKRHVVHGRSEKACTYSRTVWAAIPKTAARADLIRRDPLEDNPAAVRDGMGQANLFAMSTSHPQPKLKESANHFFSC